MLCFYPIPLLCIFMTVSRKKSGFLCSIQAQLCHSPFILQERRESKLKGWRKWWMMESHTSQVKIFKHGDTKFTAANQIQTRSNKKALCSFPDQLLPSALVCVCFHQWIRLRAINDAGWRICLSILQSSGSWQQLLLQTRSVKNTPRTRSRARPLDRVGLDM